MGWALWAPWDLCSVFVSLLPSLLTAPTLYMLDVILPQRRIAIFGVCVCV